MNTLPSFNKYARRLQALCYGIRYPWLLKKVARHSVQYLFREGSLKRGVIPQKPLHQIVEVNQEIRLQNCNVREGNITYCELIAIAAIIANQRPAHLLEIGTFDGNTTLQMALNAPENALIHTIDLPEGEYDTHVPILHEDIKYVQDIEKRKRKYVGTTVEQKILQHFGDSTAYDFNLFACQGPIDFCFIDGGHSYECVKSDTEKALNILAPQGILLWHDFDPNCPGVYTYLSELAEQYPLSHLAGTQLVALFIN